MRAEKEVVRMIRPRFSDAGWKTVRSALDSWPRTLRLSVIMLVAFTPPLVLGWLTLDLLM